MHKNITVSLFFAGCLAATGCDKTTTFENIPYEYFDMAGVDSSIRIIPPRPLADAIQYDRVGRPLVSLMLVNPFGFYKDVSYADEAKDRYNGAVPMRGWTPYAPQPFMQSNLALWDSFDSVCGNQPGATPPAPQPATQTRYEKLANIFADDRLWVDTTQVSCKNYMALEAKSLGITVPDDCGGRPLVQTPIGSPAVPLDAIDTMYNILIGIPGTVTDGVATDADGPIGTQFPFVLPTK